MNASVNASVADFLTIAADQAIGSYGNLTFLMFNATLGVIVLDPSITDISVLTPVIGAYFDQDIFSIPQACAYPISGMRDEPCFQFFTYPLTTLLQANMASSIGFCTTA